MRVILFIAALGVALFTFLLLKVRRQRKEIKKLRAIYRLNPRTIARLQNNPQYVNGNERNKVQ